MRPRAARDDFFTTACAPIQKQFDAPLANGSGESLGTLRMVLDETTPLIGEPQIAARATASNGEQFAGKVILESSVSQGDSFGQAAPIDRRGERRDRSGVVTGSFESSTTTSSRAQGTLIGDKGRHMTCQFTLASPMAGIGGGGVGSCKLSDGATAAVVF